MFSQWLAGLFHDGYTSSGDHRKHGMSDEDEYYSTQPRSPVPHKPSVVVTGQDMIRANNHPSRSEEEVYIEKMTDLLQELNERLAECPKGVTVFLELTNPQTPYITNTAPKTRYRIEGTVGKTL